MPHIIEDRILETTTTTGTGALTLAGAITGFRAFSAVCTIGDTLPYFVEALDAVGAPSGDYEYGIGTYSGVNTLTRTTVQGSSNADAAVDFAAGSKNVGICLTMSELLTRTQIAQTAAVGASGTSVDFTGILSGAKRIVIPFGGISTNGTDNLLVQIGDSGGVENTGYAATSSNCFNGVVPAVSQYTAGFGILSAAAANTLYGAVTLTLVNAATNFWAISGCLALGNSANLISVAGGKALSGVLDRVRITTTGGTQTFDLGSFALQVEY